MMKKLFLAALVLAASVSASAQGWLELPASANPSRPDIRIVTTQYMTLRDGSEVRSHTYRYDTGLRISLWVAYPLNASLIGEGSRGDGWHPYAGLDEALQPALYKGFSYGSGYDRGHQIPSADRLDRDINLETFAFINATPQRHDFNGGVWTDLERLVRTWAKRSDTLYVVTGVIPGKERIRDNAGDPVCIPDAYYKAVLRRDTDRRGTVRWSACAVLLPHRTASHPEKTWNERCGYLREFALSVADLGKAAGESFFPRLAEAVGKDAAQRLLQKDPSGEDWWWK